MLSKLGLICRFYYWTLGNIRWFVVRDTVHFILSLNAISFWYMCVLVKRITICLQSLAALEWTIGKYFRLFFMLLNVCGSIRSYLESNLRHDQSYVSGSTKCLEAVRSVGWLKYKLEGGKDPCIRSKMVKKKCKNDKYLKLFKSWYICLSNDCLRQSNTTVPNIASHFMSFIPCQE